MHTGRGQVCCRRSDCFDKAQVALFLPFAKLREEGKASFGAFRDAASLSQKLCRKEHGMVVVGWGGVLVFAAGVFLWMERQQSVHTQSRCSGGDVYLCLWLLAFRADSVRTSHVMHEISDFCFVAFLSRKGVCREKSVWCNLV